MYKPIRSLMLAGMTLTGVAVSSSRCFADCYEISTTYDRSMCLQAEEHKAMVKMEKAFSRALTNDDKLLAKLAGIPTPDIRPAIRETQTRWESWEKAQCELEGDATMGSAASWVIPACRLRLTIERTRALNDIAKQLQW